MRLACPARLRALWHHGVELARRVAGEQIAIWRAAEYIAAEGIAGRPTGTPVGDRALVALMRLTRRLRRAAQAARLAAEAEPGGARPDGADAQSTEDAQSGADVAPALTDAFVAEAIVPSVAELACCDAFALDTRLRVAVQAIARAEPRIGRLLRILVDLRLYRALGFPSTEHYVRERLGISLRKTWALVKIEKTARRAGAFAEAYEQGRLSWVRALTLVPVVDRHTAGDWIARAHAVTVRRLTDEVNWVLEARDVFGPDVPLVPPPMDSVLVSPARALSGAANASARVLSGAVSIGPAHAARGAAAPGARSLGVQCHETSLDTRVQIGAAPVEPPAWTKYGTGAIAAAEVVDTEIGFSGPASVVALFRDALDAFTRTGEPRWTAVERLLTRVVADWEAEPRHRDPVFARDGWRCTVPACSARRQLHDHHLRFRSHGGGNERANRTTVCAAHHLHGIHAGVIRAWGVAPHAVHWQLGIRPGAAPLLSYVGDRLCVEAAERPATAVTRR